MASQTKYRRWFIGMAVLLAAVTATIVLLAFTHASAELKSDTARCFASFGQTQWPKWIGCAMATHESLAGGLVATVGALFAAWLAYTGIQDQIAQTHDQLEREITLDRERTDRIQSESKEVALLAITQPIHAAAATLFAINKALASDGVPQTTESDSLVRLGIDYLRQALDHFTIREALRNLEINDRLLYVVIVATLGTLVNTATHPSPILDRQRRLTHQREALLKLRRYLRHFNDELADVFDRDSGLSKVAT